MKYQTPQLKQVGAASLLIQLKPVSQTDHISPNTQEAPSPALEAGN